MIPNGKRISKKGLAFCRRLNLAGEVPYIWGIETFSKYTASFQKNKGKADFFPGFLGVMNHGLR